MKTGKTLGKHKDRKQMANIPELSIDSCPDCQTSQIVAIHPSVVVLFLVLVAICPSLVVVVVSLIVVVVAINPSLVVVVATPMFGPPPSLLLL